MLLDPSIGMLLDPSIGMLDPSIGALLDPSIVTLLDPSIGTLLDSCIGNCGAAIDMLGEWNGRHWWSGARRGKMRAKGEGRGGWAYGRSDVAFIQGLAELHQIMRCFLLGLPLSKLILHLARTALCRRRTSRVPLLASARRMLTERARARAAAARVIVVGRSLRSLALPILAAPRAGLWFGCHQDDVVEWLQCVCGPRTPDIRRICAHRERQQ